MDIVGAYSAQNLTGSHLNGARSRTEDQQGIRTGQKEAGKGIGRSKEDGNEVKLPSEAVKEAAQNKLPGAPALTRVNSAKPTDETRDAEAKAAEDQELRELRASDQEVRAHESAHKAAAGQHGGSVSFDYKKGPDGRLYAVGGEVSIDTSSESTPEATIAKMRQVQAAAMAPANPSGQDRAVAAAASAKSTAAARELQNAKQDDAAGQSQGLQNTAINSRVGEYLKNEDIINAPRLLGKNSETTGFQDTGTIGAGKTDETAAKKGISTYA